MMTALEVVIIGLAKLRLRVCLPLLSMLAGWSLESECFLCTLADTPGETAFIC